MALLEKQEALCLELGQPERVGLLLLAMGPLRFFLSGKLRVGGLPTFGNVEADEVTSLRPGPGHVGDAGKLLVEDVEHFLKLGRDQGSVVVH